jgi:protein gp37
MSDKSPIEWLAKDGMAGATWNPLRARNLATGKVGWFCEHKSALCTNCYAERMNLWIGTGLAYEPVNRSKVDVFLDERILTEPLRWRRPRLIFPGSMTDLFADWVTDEMLDRIFAVMALAPRHTFLMLTKRPERAARYLAGADASGDGVAVRVCTAAKILSEAVVPFALPSDRVFDAKSVALGWPWKFMSAAWPLPNVWLGYSGADEPGVVALLRAPAVVRWLSIEPLLAPVDVSPFMRRPGARALELLGRDGYPGVDWVVTGAESGSGARRMDLDWVRSLRDQCAAARVPFFFKQDALNGRKIPTPELDGRRWVEMPRTA